MKIVVSYALFGDPRYARYLPAVVRAAQCVYAGFTMRLHWDETHAAGYYSDVVRLLEKWRILETRLMPTTPERCKAMLWRMAPVFDPEVDATFCRDLDSLPLPRERGAMNEFLNSDAKIHCIWDNPYHSGLMGGMSGFRSLAGTGMSLDTFYGYPFNWTGHGADQEALNKVFGHGVGLMGVRDPRPTDSPAEKLAPHIGSSGFQIGPAIEWYDRHGAATATTIREAEKLCGHP
jgi:hypothetical protein